MILPNYKFQLDSLSPKALKEERADLAEFEGNEDVIEYIDARFGGGPHLTTGSLPTAKANPSAGPSRMSGQPETDPAMIAASLHEAAHAVTALLLGGGLYEARVEKNGTGHIRVNLELLSPEQRVAVACVGRFAELKAGFVRYQGDSRYESDEQDERTALGIDGLFTQLGYQRAGHALGDRVVREHWPTIQAVATELLRTPMLSGEDINTTAPLELGDPTAVAVLGTEETPARTV